MRDEREPENEGNASTPVRPLGATEEGVGGHHRADERERERMRDGTMSEGPSQEIDVRYRCAGCGNHAHAARGSPVLSPSSDGKADGSM